MIFTVLKVFACHTLDHTYYLLARHAAIEDVALSNSVDKELNLWLRDEGASIGREQLVNQLACCRHQILVVYNSGPWHRHVVTGHAYFLYCLDQGLTMHQSAPIDTWPLLLWIINLIIILVNLINLNLNILFGTTILFSTIFCICIPHLLCCLCLLW
jgi:hypothetical protein